MAHFDLRAVDWSQVVFCAPTGQARGATRIPGRTRCGSTRTCRPPAAAWRAAVPRARPPGHGVRLGCRGSSSATPTRPRAAAQLATSSVQRLSAATLERWAASATFPETREG
eukprot:4859380-Pleurochrysis_carterae.AAC.2